MRFYEALELQPALKLDPADLQKRFYAASRKWHPDRFTRASAEQQSKALEMTAVLNDAFRTLKDPVARAEYFLKQHGLELSKDAPPELLEEVFDLNMALEELRAGDDARPQLEASADRFRQMLAEADVLLSGHFASFDSAADDAGHSQALEAIRATLNRRRYIANLVRDVDAALHR